MKADFSCWNELIVDSFAGGGGASTGIELATGRTVNIAINHDPDAILMHKTNHPQTRHFQASVWDVDPKEVCNGDPVGLLWASPDCKHFSKAKGGKPVDKTIRGLAWIVLRWAGTVRPRVIMLENVEEFQTWGPVRKGRPVKKKAGQTFHKWLGQLKALGYNVEWRELVAADYGAPTTRKRFFLIARRDGLPIVWPEPTHAPADSPEVLAGTKKPWRSAAEIIDWSLPCPSIFDTREQVKEKYGLNAQRPLRPNTVRRVARGVDKFVIKSANPFLVIVNHAGDFRGQGLGEPLQTITAKHGYGVVTPTLTAIGQTGGGDRTRRVDTPTHTQVSKAEECVVQPLMAPLTVTNTSNSVGGPAEEPLHTVTTAGNQILVTPAMIQYHTEQSEHVRGQAVTDPIMTVDAANRYGLAAATMTKYYGNDQHGQDIQQPLHTVTAKDREGVTLAHMVKMKGDNLGGSAGEPVQTITAGGGHHGVVTTTVCRAAPDADLHNWPKIREVLNTYCGYSLEDDEVLLFQIGASWYFMADIGLRMLTPRELYRANGFPDDYIIEKDYTGNTYGKTKQVARCGNAVPPPFATALVKANLPEWCENGAASMAELRERWAV